MINFINSDKATAVLVMYNALLGLPILDMRMVIVKPEFWMTKALRDSTLKAITRESHMVHIDSSRDMMPLITLSLAIDPLKQLLYNWSNLRLRCLVVRFASSDIVLLLPEL